MNVATILEGKIVLFIGSAKISEREGIISPSGFYGQLSDYQSHDFGLIYPVSKFSFKGVKMWGQPKISSYCFVLFETHIFENFLQKSPAIVKLQVYQFFPPKQPPKVFCNRRCKLTGKHLYQNLFFSKVTVLRPATLSKRRLWHKCFPVNFSKFLRTPFLQNPSRRLLLYF